MEFEVVVMVPALFHLEEIHSYISQFDPNAAERTLAKIYHRLELLRSFRFSDRLIQTKPVPIVK